MLNKPVCQNCRIPLPRKKKYCSRCAPLVYRMNYKELRGTNPLSRVSKACPHCKQLLPIDAFPKHKRKSGNGKSYMFVEWLCRSCFNVNARISKARREHRKQQLPSTFTLEEWERALEYFDHSCAYCGYPSDKLQQEHFIPLSKGGGYTKDNIVPACPECNLSKSDAMPQDWLPEDVYVAVSAFLSDRS